jgi:hypothetical protein
MPHDEYMDLLVCKELLLHGKLPHSSLHTRLAINNFTYTLIPLKEKACERIATMLHNKWILASPVASTLERHSIYEIAQPPPFQFIVTRGIRDGQCQIQCLIQLKRNLLMCIFNWEGKLKRRDNFRIGHSSSRSGTTNEEVVNNDLPGINTVIGFFKDCNRGCFNNELVYGNSERLPTVPGCFITSEDRGSIAKGSIDEGNFRDRHNRNTIKANSANISANPERFKEINNKWRKALIVRLTGNISAQLVKGWRTNWWKITSPPHNNWHYV